MKKIFWRSTHNKDKADFRCCIFFSIDGPESDYKALIDHYRHLSRVYCFAVLFTFIGN